MKKLELVDEVLEVSHKGVSHDMRVPSNEEIRILRSSSEEGDADHLAVMYEFFTKLGLPLDFVKGLSPKHTVKIMETISDVKS